MKRFVKVLAILTLALSLTVLAACKKTEKKIKIGILQFANQSALVQAVEGFQAGLAEAGYDETKVEFNLIKANGDAAATQTAATQLVATSDMIFVVATSATQIVKAEAEKQRVSTPILFTAVTDPVGAGIIASMENPGGQITGVSNLNPIADQVTLMMRFADVLTKNATAGFKVGILYTSSETNSKKQAELFKTELIAREIPEANIITSTVAGTEDIETVATTLANQVDIIYVPTDNNLASNIGVLNKVIKSTKVPVFGGEANHVYDGATMSLSLEYTALGKQVAAQAVKILAGTSPASIAAEFGSPDHYAVVVNSTQLKDLGITLPASVSTTNYPSLTLI